MSEDEITYGEIRKKVEAKLHKKIGLSASKAQVDKIRELAPKIATGEMKFDDALQEVIDMEEYPGN